MKSFNTKGESCGEICGSYFFDAKKSAAFMKGGMTDVRFCGTAFCIVDLMGDIEAPDRETERRTREKQKEITFQNGVDGNICSYFFSTRVTGT